MRTPWLLVALALVAGDAAAKKKPRPYYDDEIYVREPTAEELTAKARAALAVAEAWVGTWTGKATWTGCSVDGGARLSLAIAPGLTSDGDALLDGLGDLGWAAAGKGLALIQDGLEIQLLPGKKATGKLVLETKAGCVAKATLARPTSKMPSCDALRALATIEAGCDQLPAETRGDDLAAVTKAWKKWSKLKGKKKKAQTKACTTRAVTLRDELLVCKGGPRKVGVEAACEDYQRVVDRTVRCDKLPQEAKDGVVEGYESVVAGGAMGAEACQQPAVALTEALDAFGCPP